MKITFAALLLCMLTPIHLRGVAQSAATSLVPNSSGTTLDGHTVSIPHDLYAPATILILGFTRSSSDATTAWEKPVRLTLATTPSISFYDVPFLEDAPSFVRPLIIHSLRKVIPEAVKPNFLPLAQHEADWKQAVGYSNADPNAAYIVLVDRSGRIHWQTHQPITPERLNQLASAAHQLAATGH